MTQTFVEYVDEWASLQSTIAAAKRDLKKLTDQEMKMRKAIAESVDKALQHGLEEGTNKYTLPDGRTLKVKHGVDRKVDESALTTAREEFAKANDVPEGITFDGLLRRKYEVDIANFRKLEGSALLAFSRAITTSVKAPGLELS